MPQMRSASALWLTGIVSAAAILIVVSVALNILADNRSDTLLPADTPEGTVQRYLFALVDDDVDTALGYVEKDLKDRCGLTQYWETSVFLRNQDFSAQLDRTREVDDSVIVTVEITETDFNPPFGNNQYSFPVTFTVKSLDGAWRITEPPWPMAWCPLERETPATPTIAEPSPQPGAALIGLKAKVPAEVL